MKPLRRTSPPIYTNRILQFGEGNFLRAFADWMVHEMNRKADFDAGVVVVQPIADGLIDLLNEQGGLYTLYQNGIKNGEVVSEHKLIDCIQQAINPYEDYGAFLGQAENPDLRFVISNTTEAGISYHESDQLTDQPQQSFPGKLTAFLYRRYQAFEGASDKGLIHIPCELIKHNGEKLKTLILQYAEEWALGDDFVNWLNDHNVFCNTLVDRIVPGYPKDRMEAIQAELGYDDKLVTEGEQFHLWVIEGPAMVQEEFPATQCGLNVIFTDDMTPYRTRKVRILNGAHTSMVPVGYLYGIDTVREAVEDAIVGQFIQEAIFTEICPTLDLPPDELRTFANDVLDRFRNPYLQHALISISLNSVSKWKTRVLPSVLMYIKRKNEIPPRLCFSLAALLAFYRADRNGAPIPLKDDQAVLAYFEKQWGLYDSGSLSLQVLVQDVLSKTEFWEQDLTQLQSFSETITADLALILSKGMKESLKFHLHQSIAS
ncbi:MAG: tagaturonate reductase [Bacteroidota bacterium]